MCGTLAFIGLIIPLQLHSSHSEATHIQESLLSSLSYTSTVSEIKSAISYVAIKYGIEESEFMKVVECESSFDVNATGDSGRAFGLMQFHKPTFYEFCNGDYYSPQDQLECAGKMFQTEKLKRHWSCWSKYFSN